MKPALIHLSEPKLKGGITNSNNKKEEMSLRGRVGKKTYAK